MPRLYYPVKSVAEGTLSISGDKAHYLSSVLRCKKGDDLTIFDGKGNCFQTTILQINRKEILAKVEKKYPCVIESSLKLSLVQGVLKGEKMDVVIQKTTELGVSEIFPVITERSQVHNTRKSSRWRRISEEASRQSGRSVVPLVHDAVNFMDFFSLLGSSEKIKGFIFYEKKGQNLKQVVSHVRQPHSFYIVIGPEGGFSKEEVSFAKSRGFVVVSLGNWILRAETAAISAVTLIQFLFGDLG